jgi:penicillin-binding protein 1A
VVQGGSPITQQVARNIFLTPEQSLRRKLQEAALALRIEGMMSKDEILELYLNRIYFGGGAYGVEAASQTYFGKPAAKLNLAEAALLAALPKAPTRLDPANDLAAAVRRSRLVLSAMQKEGWISAGSTEGDFGYVLDLAAKEAKALLPHAPPDLVVRLAVDPRLQSEAAKAVRAGVAQFSARGATEAALVALAPDGGVRALVGGLDHRDSPFDRATQAKRQPGSAFKTFVYAAALEAGLAPDDVRPDAPVRIGDYAPTNADGLYIGNVTLAEALARSINTVAVRVTSEIGVERVAELARRFGLKDIPAHPDLPVALGAYETTLIDLTSAYQVLQNGGGRAQPYLIESIANARGDILYRRNPRPAEAVFDERRAATLTQMLKGVIEAPYGTGRRAALDRPAAGKTGTSQNYRDAWFVGFTPDWVCGVWMGDDRGRPMQGVTGGEGPAQVWRQFMLAAHQGLAARDFERSVAKADPRDALYAGLAEDFERDARTGRP